MLLQVSQAVRQLQAAPKCKQLQLIWAYGRHGADHSCLLHTSPTEQQLAAGRSEQPQQLQSEQQEQQQQQQQQQQFSIYRQQHTNQALLAALRTRSHLLQHSAADPAIGKPAATVTSLVSQHLQHSQPAAAAAAAAGASRSYFQVQNERSGHYWARQFNLDGRNVTMGLLATNVAAYGMQMISPGFTRFCMRVGSAVADGEYWRLLTAAFLHGNILHCGINMLALYNIGPAVENTLGGNRFLALYLGSAVGGNLLGYMLGSGFSSSMGSSGALYGIFAGYMVSRWVNRKAVPISQAEMMSIGTTVAINFALMTAFSGAMDTWAHLGGFISGAVITALITPRYGRR